jgi:hypothetical protein
VKWKEARAALAKRALERGQKSTTTGKFPAPNAKQVESPEEHLELGKGWSHVVRRGCVVNAAPPPSAPNPIPPQVTEARKPIMTPTSETAKPKRPAPKTPAAPKAASVKPAVTKAVAAQPSSTKLVVTPHPTSSPLKGISDLLDQLPIEACVELTCRLLTSISSLPLGVARLRAVLRTIILFVAEYGSTP